MMQLLERPCEFCGSLVTKTRRQAEQRKYWTCGRECSGKLRIQRGDAAKTWQPNRFRGRRETRMCVKCGQPVTRYVTEQNHDQSWKCSRRCMLAILGGVERKRRGKTSECAACRKSFYASPADLARARRFCSAECAHSGLVKPTVSKECMQCGATMVLQPSVALVRKFCSGACWLASKFKNTTGRVHNGKPARFTGEGYVKIWEPEHPNATRGWVLEHRWLMEQHIGRLLSRAEEVDHVNDVRDDNRLENLNVLSKTDHRKKTGRTVREKRLTMRAKLAEYERLYGQLPT